ncbi:TP53 regulating kinase [Nematocida minor]|uniref:TP53 regulating kinase n=1 Tax=Nematocida minor TaxID=1912983 RepID=UPI002220B0F0|nr:TP53 regulating kinase [Nematocida minor]KAI5191303.1 TP53 regulating kinase [Nematocida minor]
MESISIGAEATVYKKNGYIVKVRHPKAYRIDAIDKSIRKTRTRFESKLLKKIEHLGIAPKVLSDEAAQNTLSEHKKDGVTLDCAIVIECLPGATLKECLMSENKENTYFDLLLRVYECIGLLHSSHVVHGDLTPNNILVDGQDVKIIDFGLGKITNKVEDKAVDLYVFERTMASLVNISVDARVDDLLSVYVKNNTENGKDVLNKLKEVRRRGRKRELNAVG